MKQFSLCVNIRAIFSILCIHLNKAFSTITAMLFLGPIQLAFSFIISANLFALVKLQTQTRTHASQSILLLARHFQHHAEKALNNMQSWRQKEPGRSLMKSIAQNREVGILEIQCRTLAQMVDMLNSTSNITALSVSLCTRVFCLSRSVNQLEDA